MCLANKQKGVLVLECIPTAVEALVVHHYPYTLACVQRSVVSRQCQMHKHLSVQKQCHSQHTPVQDICIREEIRSPSHLWFIRSNSNWIICEFLWILAFFMSLYWSFFIINMIFHLWSTNIGCNILTHGNPRFLFVYHPHLSSILQARSPRAVHGENLLIKDSIHVNSTWL